MPGKRMLCKLTGRAVLGTAGRNRALGWYQQRPRFAALPSTVMPLSSPEPGLRGWSKCSCTGQRRGKGCRGVAATGIWF